MPSISASTIRARMGYTDLPQGRSRFGRVNFFQHFLAPIWRVIDVFRENRTVEVPK